MLKGLRDYFKNLEVGDSRMIVSIIFLISFGLLIVYSASTSSSGIGNVTSQAIFAVAGFAAMIFISFIDYHLYDRWALLIYLVALGSMVLVKVPGISTTVNGAARWVSIGGITFQPSELMKPAIVIMISTLIVSMGKRMKLFRAEIILAVVTAVAVACVLLITKNLSTSLIVLCISLAIYFVGQPRKRTWVIFIVLAALAIAALIIVYFYCSEHKTDSDITNYILLRFMAWFFPDQFAESSRQTTYSMYSIGFGGLLGRGLGRGTMKYYIPYPTNDSIFAVIAEELGLVGCALIVGLFGYLIWRIKEVARHAKDKLGGLMATGICAHIAVQVIFHIGVATNLMPNTGVSLPFVSYGGTALLIQFAEMGIVLNISRQIPGRPIRTQGSSGMNEQKEQRKIRKSA